MQKSAKELSLVIAGIDAQLLLEDLKQLKASLSLELQAVRDDRRAYHKEIQELLAESKDTLIRIQAQFKVEAQLLNLIRPSAGEKEWQGNGKSSSQSRMLKQFAKSTR